MKFYIIIFLIIGFFIQCSSRRDYQKAQVSGEGDVVSTSAEIGERKQEPQKGRLLTYKGNLNLEISSGESQEIRNKVFEYLQKIEGYITTETTNNLSIKVPSQKYREATAYLKTLGKVTYESYSIEDITEAYYDSKIRLENAVKLQVRLTELLKRAKSVQETVEVEKELNRVTNEIETHKSRLFRLDNQIQFSTLTVHLIEKEKEPKLGPVGWVFYILYKGVSYLFVID